MFRITLLLHHYLRARVSHARWRTPPAVDIERRAGSVHGSRAEQQPRPEDDQALATCGRRP